jgi:hypothetical protein
MQMVGWLMIALFVWLFHGPWLAFKRAVDSEDWPSAGASLNPHPPDHCRQLAARPASRGHRRQRALLGITLSRTALLRSIPDWWNVPAHPYAVAMEAAMLAPNAEVSMYPWKEPKERISWPCAKYVPSSGRIDLPLLKLRRRVSK